MRKDPKKTLKLIILSVLSFLGIVNVYPACYVAKKVKVNLLVLLIPIGISLVLFCVFIPESTATIFALVLCFYPMIFFFVFLGKCSKAMDLLYTVEQIDIKRCELLPVNNEERKHIEKVYTDYLPVTTLYFGEEAYNVLATIERIYLEDKNKEKNVPKVTADDAIAEIKNISEEKENPVISIDEIDINTCTEIELSNLPGVGSILAKKAMEIRNRNGGFESIDEFFDAINLRERQRNNLIKMISCSPKENKVRGRRVDF